MNMRSVFAGLMVALAGLPAAAQSELTISAGPENSISWIAANDLVEMGRQCGTNIRTRVSAGAIPSLEALKGSLGADAVIMQHDVLDYLQSYRAQDPKIASSVSGVELAVPLFEQEVHVIVRPDINTPSELNGKRINIGPLTSGGFLTSVIVLDFLEIEPADTQRLPAPVALAALKRGELDAVFLVDGAPSRILSEADLGPTDAKLLDLQDPFLSEVYADASIPGGTYSFDPTPHLTIGVQSFLMTREVPLNSPECNVIADTVALISKRRDLLASQGHQKWGAPEYFGVQPDWPLSVCAVAGLDPARTLTCQ